VSWATIPPVLYDPTLSEVELQTLYVKVLRAKVAQLEDESAPAAQLAQARAFLAEAEAALARYRRRRRGP
jgi:hypothetical protein